MTKPVNPLVGPMLTDMYQITMSYAYWKANRHDEDCVFDLFFRKNPFKGGYTVFGGLTEALAFVKTFKFTESDIHYLKTNPSLSHVEAAFFEWLAKLDTSKVTIHAVPEGSIVFPRVPLLRVEGPLVVCQLLETPLLNLINYATLMTTNAARFRFAAGKDKRLLEFGVRRAQGPDGALSATRYSFIGGFDSTSNVLAGKLFGIGISGTHAHAFVSSFTGFEDIKDPSILTKDQTKVNFVESVLAWRKKLGFQDTNTAELAAFTSYAQAFPSNFLALVDTYDTLKSGVPNFLVVTSALADIGYKGVGIRLDSGDLALLSKQTRALFTEVGQRIGRGWYAELRIVASDDINEEKLHHFNKVGHEMDVFGVGTHLVTCQAQPSLGGVYKLVSVGGKARIKISGDFVKMTIPGKKDVYRLYVKDKPVADLLTEGAGDVVPKPGEQLLVCDPYDEKKRWYVTPTKVLPLYKLYFQQGRELVGAEPLSTIRERAMKGYLEEFAEYARGHGRDVAGYPLVATEQLGQNLRRLYQENAVIPRL